MLGSDASVSSAGPHDADEARRRGRKRARYTAAPTPMGSVIAVLRTAK